jgi:hypothetical protein
VRRESHYPLRRGEKGQLLAKGGDHRPIDHPIAGALYAISSVACRSRPCTAMGNQGTDGTPRANDSAEFMSHVPSVSRFSVCYANLRLAVSGKEMFRRSFPALLDVRQEIKIFVILILAAFSFAQLFL